MKRKSIELTGALWDMDDTLLNNCPTGNPLDNFHQVSRLQALHDVGRELHIDALTTITAEESSDAFHTSPVHTVDGAFWTAMRQKGVVHGNLDPSHPLIIALNTKKNRLYREILVREGKPFPGAAPFIDALSHKYDIANKQAIASMGQRDDITTFINLSQLQRYFPNERIFGYESVTRPKPDPEIFELAHASLGSSAANRASVAVFEDDPRGLTAARKAGFFVCAIATRFPYEYLSNHESRPDIVAHDYDEFAELFSVTLA